jgi:hypothetical protein
MADTTLNRLLTAAADLGPEHGPALSSHLPMALLALHALGADATRLQAFFDPYSRRFATEPATMADDGRAEMALFGRIGAFTTLRRRFTAELAARGRDALLRRLLPALMPGVAGAAFHGLIRTAYAVQAGHDRELVAALAYWAARWLPLPPEQDSSPISAEAWLQSLQQAPPGPVLPDRLIADRAARLVHSPAFQPWAGPVPAAPDWPLRLARMAVQRYLSSGHFTVLHLVTATHALRVLQPWLDDAAWPHFVRAYAAVWLTARTEPATAPRADPGRAWPAIVEQALRSDDEHVIKLVHSCREEEAVYGGPAWRHAAALVVQTGS